MEYTKEWLPLEGQVDRLIGRGLEVEDRAPKADFGTYNALAIIAYLLRSIEPQPSWVLKLADLFHAFPTSHALTLQSMGVPEDWETLELLRG